MCARWENVHTRAWATVDTECMTEPVDDEGYWVYLTDSAIQVPGKLPVWFVVCSLAENGQGTKSKKQKTARVNS